MLKEYTEHFYIPAASSQKVTNSSKKRQPSSLKLEPPPQPILTS
jgi:hypothetical protein